MGGGTHGSRRSKFERKSARAPATISAVCTMYDDDEKYDLSAKRNSDEPSDFDRAMMVQSSTDEPAGPSSEPGWAAAYKAAEADKKRRKPTRLSGTVITWNKGFGFIKVPGQADLYVHQRNVERQGATHSRLHLRHARPFQPDAPLSAGFRSLLKGEPVEFVMAKMADGKLEALNVTGPGGAEPQGQPTPAEREEQEEEEEERAKARAAAKAKADAERPKKPVTAFVPRTVKRAAPKSTTRPPFKKPAANGAASGPASSAPTAPASADGPASAAPAAAEAAPEIAD